MNKVLAIIATISFLVFAANEETYKADVKASAVHWLGKKTTGQHEGNVNLKSGSLKMLSGTPVSGEFVMDMNSITSTDIKDPDDNANLVKHLKDDKFFDVANNPTATITLKKFEKIESAKATEPNYKATADLSIKGITNEIQFPTRIDMVGGNITANADITIDRTKWKIVFQSKTVFSTLGDKFIYDDVLFSVKVVLKK